MISLVISTLVIAIISRKNFVANEVIKFSRFDYTLFLFNVSLFTIICNIKNDFYLLLFFVSNAFISNSRSVNLNLLLYLFVLFFLIPEELIYITPALLLLVPFVNVSEDRIKSFAGILLNIIVFKHITILTLTKNTEFEGYQSLLIGVIAAFLIEQIPMSLRNIVKIKLNKVLYLISVFSVLGVKLKV